MEEERSAGQPHLCFRESLAVLQGLGNISCCRVYGEDCAYDNASEVVIVLLHEIEELHEDILPVLYAGCHRQEMHGDSISYLCCCPAPGFECFRRG
jgi:hypothetical protein